MNRFLPLAVMAVVALPAWADDKEELAAAAGKTAESTNYSFRGVAKTDLPFPNRTGGPQEMKFEGQVDAESAHILTDTQEIVRLGSKTAVRPRGEWRVLDDAGPGGAPGRNLGRMMGMMGQRPPRPPHEELKDFGSKLEKASKAEEKEAVGDAQCTVYKFDLTEEGARSMFPTGGGLGRLGGNAPVSFSGKGKAWVANGTVVKIEWTTTLSASFGGNDFEVTSTRATTIFDVGKAKVEIPEGARKAIQSKTD